MADPTSHPTPAELPAKFTYDVWYKDRWIGMATGATPREAREQLNTNFPNTPADQLLMTPFYGCGTSEETYEILTGRRASR